VVKLVESYEKWLKTENERLDSEERERKMARKLIAGKVQNAAADKLTSSCCNLAGSRRQVDPHH